MYRLFSERRYLIPFRTALLPQIFTDVLVIGSGIAGMRAALAAAEHSDVILVAKGQLRDSNTYWAQGGIAAVLPDVDVEGEADSLEQHARDTMDAGADLCVPDIVQQVVAEGPRGIDDLRDAGIAFDRDGSGLQLGREGGHRCHRILHVEGDATGKAIAMGLDQTLRDSDRVRVFDECFVLDLITLEGGSPQCVGAITHHAKYGLQVIWSAATILATGGCGQVYRETTNPGIATGDGLAMAYRAGAEVADLAFMQFHPTTLYVAGASRSLITEAVRGEGGVLVDRDHHRFMPDYHPLADLAPRDVVSRAILAQMAKTHHTHVYLDVRHIGADRFAARFPGIDRLLRKFEIDPGDSLIPIHPSAHYMIGGVRTDAAGRTNVRGLYAAGEVACTGLHGANRLASNSLLEGLAFGRAAGETCREMNGHAPAGNTKVISDVPISDRSELDLGDVRSSLRSVMWREVGIERTGNRLREVGEMIDFWARYTLDKIFDERPGWEMQNLLMVGALITRAAAWREESRGTHYRMDHPDARDTFRLHDVWRRHREDVFTVESEKFVRRS